MLRILFSPRVAVLHLLAVGALVVCGLLGRWQLGVFEDSGRPQAAVDPAPVAVGTLSGAGRHLTGEAIRRQVTAEGTFDADRQLLVTGRDDGLWILTALDLGDGTSIPVVRGWVASAEDPATAVPEGRVTVTGRLQASEPTDSVRRVRQVPQGQVQTVSSAELINLWRGVKLRDGFVIATAQTPPPAVAARPVPVVPPTTEGVLTWRNLAYAAQWWIFGLFAVFMWWHFIRDAVRKGTAGPEPGPTADPQTEPETEPDPESRPAAV
ncbi:SURF1 family protein [Planomonospora sp. ID67723]|uniref:SURF1 family protein n=1 Tax=Planomonospora sp. ID67723 TaxID=2738134 RepID=UPI0018C44BB3|nr:SURF1 family protein [Planomonospora sp. ID67723]MBG0828177.1 SURF1 family protein [Planomonospora sp. ID67723]